MAVGLFVFHSASSQSKWGEWKELYHDQSTTVKIQFKLIDNGCDLGKTSKFHCMIEGKLKSNDYYVNWKMDYVDCSGNIVSQNYSLNIGRGRDLNIAIEDMAYIFKGELTTPYYEVVGSSTQAAGSLIKAVAIPKDPEGIEGQTNINIGESTKLSVKGGSLGLSSQWVWYEDTCCGTSIGKGKSIIVHPSETKNYYVRAEGAEPSSLATVVITVDKNSHSPLYIAGKINLCEGEKTTLQVIGGKLGLNAQWIWYENTCLGKKVGEGASVEIAPNRDTKYYVRAEGPTNATSCVEILISVHQKSVAANYINCVKEICEGELAKLEISGGFLSSEAEWKWYSGRCDGKLFATGMNTSVSPSQTTTYYVKGEGFCNTTACVSTTMIVYRKSKTPNSIILDGKAYKHRKISLQVVGGSLGADAEWKWYKGSCVAENEIGTGSNIITKTNSDSYFFVKGVGKCNETNCISIYITPEPFHKWEKRFNSGKFMHFGWYTGPGVVLLNVPSYGISPDGLGGYSPFKDSIIDIGGLDWQLGCNFHPIMTDFFSLGFNAELLGGNIRNILKPNSANPEHYTYAGLKIGGELALGTKNRKLLTTYQANFMFNNYQNISRVNGDVNQTFYDDNFVQEILGLGIRFISYKKLFGDHNAKRCIDFTFNLCRRSLQGEVPLLIVDKNKNIDNWNSGFGFTWWLSPSWIIQGSYSSNVVRPSSSSNPTPVTEYFFQGKLVHSFNKFY
jgi:hypothetical protein